MHNIRSRNDEPVDQPRALNKHGYTRSRSLGKTGYAEGYILQRVLTGADTGQIMLLMVWCIRCLICSFTGHRFETNLIAAPLSSSHNAPPGVFENSMTPVLPDAEPTHPPTHPLSSPVCPVESYPLLSTVYPMVSVFVHRCWRCDHPLTRGHVPHANTGCKHGQYRVSRRKNWVGFNSVDDR